MNDVKEKLLTAEQMVMWRQAHHDGAQELNADNRKRFNRKLRQELEAMTPNELSTTRAAMQSQWDGLAPEKKTKFLERIAAKAQKTADKLAATGADDDES